MISAILTALILGLLLFKIFWKSKINLPGPLSLPFVGNIYQISRDRPHETFDKWHKKFNRVFKMYELGTPVVVVGSYEGIQEVLMEKGEDFAGRPCSFRYGSSTEFTSWQDGICMAPPDESWEMLRQTAKKNLEQFDEGMAHINNVENEICQDMLNRLASHNGKPFRPEEDIREAVINHITMILIGRKSTKHDALHRQILELVVLEMELYSTASWAGTPSERANSLFSSIVEIRHSLYMQMKEKVIGDKTDGLKSALESFLAVQEKSKFVGGEARIESACSNLISASVGSLTSTLMSFVNIVTHYTDVFEKLQVEVDDVLKGRPPSLEDRQSMPYAQATIFELLRYACITPLSIPHMTQKDTAIGGAIIPKGTKVLINLWSAMHDEIYWPKPFEFRPERFLDDSGNLLPPDHVVRKRLIPFGAGPRACIGESFSLERLFLLMTSMVQKFDIEQANPKVSCDPRKYDLMIVLTLPDFQVKMSPRKGQ